MEESKTLLDSSTLPWSRDSISYKFIDNW